jgi:hypothetical protein
MSDQAVTMWLCTFLGLASAVVVAAIAYLVSFLRATKREMGS